MAQPAESETATCGGACEYIAASYVKFIELAGARAVPVSYFSSDAEIDDLMEQVNGFFFPGGAAALPRAAKRVVDNALSISASGGFFPVYGVCLGYEWIVESVGGANALQPGFDAENLTLSLNFTPDGRSSRFYATVGVQDLLASQPITMNNHKMGLTPHSYEATSALRETFKVLSTNLDRKGQEFVSSIEARVAPLYGTQYHPEKNIFEWGTYPNGQPYEVIQHSFDAVRIAQAIANFFVNEARKNDNVYDLSKDHMFFENLPTDNDRAPEFVSVYHLFPQAIAV